MRSCSVNGLNHSIMESHIDFSYELIYINTMRSYDWMHPNLYNHGIACSVNKVGIVLQVITINNR